MDGEGRDGDDQSLNRVGAEKMRVLIRRAGPEDAEPIAAVLQESFVEFKALYTDGGFAATALDAAQVLARIREGPVWLAARENAVVGTVAARS